MGKHLTDIEIIDALRCQPIADATGKTVQAVFNWRHRGIPGKIAVRRVVARLAHEAGLNVDPDEFPYTPPAPSHDVLNDSAMKDPDSASNETHAA